LRICQSLSNSIISQHFMKFKCLLQCSQEPFISLYAQLDESPHPTDLRSILILFSHLCSGLPSSIFPTGFPTKNLHAFFLSYMPCPSKPPRSDGSDYTYRRVQIMKLFIIYIYIYIYIYTQNRHNYNFFKFLRLWISFRTANGSELNGSKHLPYSMLT
jgi:hypothetical protein